jgi:hypothetical protein
MPESSTTRGRRRGIPLWWIVALIAGVALFAAPAAEAACGGVEHYRPLEPRRSPPPLAIGDSVMLGAIEPLRRSGFEIDVRGCRSMSEGLRLLSRRRRTGSLPGVVVMALGNNFSIAPGEIARAREILGPKRVLGLVTPRESASSRQAIRAAARRWPARVRVLGWAELSSGRPWTWDGLHLTPDGARAFAGLLRRAYRWPQPGLDHEELPLAGASRTGSLLLLAIALLVLVGAILRAAARRPPRRARYGPSGPG